MGAGEWTGELCLKRRPGTRAVYEVCATLGYVTASRAWKISIDPGWTTDGASIPRALRWFADPFSGPWASAAVLHDALYRSHLLDRSWADGVFREAMLTSGVAAWRAWAMWAAVRAFGWLAWRDKDADQVDWFAANFVSLRAMPCHG